LVKEHTHLMNNRQGGRRRGRGGQRPQGLGGGGGGGNSSRDQRVRGNAAQLLEKYKNMARDAQLAGDRVQTEYYLQFADHYFRVLGETRSRFEDQRPRHEDDEDEGDEELMDGEGEEEAAEQPRAERQPRQDRPERFERRDRNREDRPRRERLERAERRPVRADEEDQLVAEESEQPSGIAAFLPPAIGPVGDDEPAADEPGAMDEVAEEAPRPRRRTRRPRAAEGGDEVAPAA
jgi:hypothetical protein